MRQLAKQALNALGLAIAALPAATCLLGDAVGASERPYAFWTHVMAVLPGAPGMFVRRAFYRWTLARCADDVTIEFGALITRRSAGLERGVYIGPYALIGWATIGAHTLVGSRASLLSGGHQHTWTGTGWSATSAASLSPIAIGSQTWIGEGAILMADVGSGCMVAAGAVVSAAVPDGVMVAGNPARFVRRVAADPAEPAHDAHLPAVR